MRLLACNICGRIVTGGTGPFANGVPRQIFYIDKHGEEVCLKIGYFTSTGQPSYDEGDLCFDCFVWAVRADRGEKLPRPTVHELKLVKTE